MDDDLARVQAMWQRFAELDPMLGILTDPSKMKSGWDANEFWATGEAEVDDVLAWLAANGWSRAPTSVLDFGCGIGRVSTALARRGAAVVGVDVAPAMLARARELNKFGDRCEFLLNDRSDLDLLRGRRFDLVYSRLVLQHMPAHLQRGFLGALFGAMRRGGGVVVVQLLVDRASAPTHPTLPVRGHRAHLEIVGLPRRIREGQRVAVRVRVRNDSDVAWPRHSNYAIRIGNHWRDSRGGLIVYDDGRAMLPHDIGPGDEADLTLDVVVPAVGGHRTLLEMDLVEEGVGWFADQGSTPARVELPIRRSAKASVAKVLPRSVVEALRRLRERVRRRPPPRAATFDVECDFAAEMHVLPRAKLLALATEHDMNVRCERADNCAAGFQSIQFALVSSRSVDTTTHEGL